MISRTEVQEVNFGGHIVSGDELIARRQWDADALLRKRIAKRTAPPARRPCQRDPQRPVGTKPATIGMFASGWCKLRVSQIFYSGIAPFPKRLPALYRIQAGGAAIVYGEGGLNHHRLIPEPRVSSARLEKHDKQANNDSGLRDAWSSRFDLLPCKSEHHLCRRGCYRPCDQSWWKGRQCDRV
jgi:hypothetical protein